MPLKVRQSYHSAYCCKPSTRRAPTNADRAVLGTQNFKHSHNTLVNLMASDDHDERLRGALAVVLVVFLNLPETAPSQDLGQVGSDLGRDKRTGRR